MDLLLAILLSGMGDIANSPFSVPIAGCAMIACIVVAGNIASTRRREMESQERLAAIAKGLIPPPTREELALTQAPPTPSASRRYANIRLAGIICVCGALGVILFFIILSLIVGERQVLAGAACGLVPLGIGAGLLIDARLQARQLAETASARATV